MMCVWVMREIRCPLLILLYDVCVWVMREIRCPLLILLHDVWVGYEGVKMSSSNSVAWCVCGL